MTGTGPSIRPAATTLLPRPCQCPLRYSPAMRSPLVRYAYLTLGWVCVGLGAIGVVVPGMPTVVFLLVAVWAFARSSERFHRWLLAHPRFGPPVVDWQRHGVIRRRAKVAALLFMTLAVVVLVFVTGFHWAAIAAIVAVICGAALFVATRPEAPRG